MAVDITNGFKPAGHKNTYLMREVSSLTGIAHRFRCCCGMEYLHVAGDPLSGSVKSHTQGGVEILPVSCLPMFGHTRDDCPGAGAPLTCFGEYTWDGSVWCA